MLLIACSAITTVSADSAATPQKKAESVIQSLEGVIAFYAQEGSQTLSVTKNPETGLIESSERIVPFTCEKEQLWTIPIGFEHDEPLSYQYMHLLSGNTELFNLKVVTNNGQKSKDVRIRTNSKQEMWFMCCKNPDNPQLRDAYAIVWEETKDKKVAGTVFMITSLRPDMYERSMSSGLFANDQEAAKKTFKLEGRVGDDLTDSLYVFYIAETGEELNNAADDRYTFTMPVVNKRFGISVELDKPIVGRIRTVMPDGSLCKLWTNIDCVPGETYHITTHNGYYDEDRDYEQRVGRYSGKSLLNDLQRRGIDDQTVEVVDTIPGYNEMEAWENRLSPQQKVQLEMKREISQMNMEKIESIFKTAAEGLKKSTERVGGLMGIDGTLVIDNTYEQLYNQNKETDKIIQDFIKLVKDYGVPAKEMPQMYKEILQFYTKQNQGLTQLTMARAAQTKKAKKTQKYIQGLTEKYMKEMMKAME